MGGRGGGRRKRKKGGKHVTVVGLKTKRGKTKVTCLHPVKGGGGKEQNAAQIKVGKKKFSKGEYKKKKKRVSIQLKVREGRKKAELYPEFWLGVRMSSFKDGDSVKVMNEKRVRGGKGKTQEGKEVVKPKKKKTLTEKKRDLESIYTQYQGEKEAYNSIPTDCSHKRKAAEFKLQVIEAIERVEKLGGGHSFVEKNNTSGRRSLLGGVTWRPYIKETARSKKERKKEKEIGIPFLGGTAMGRKKGKHEGEGAEYKMKGDNSR